MAAVRLYDSIQKLPGIGAARAEKLEKLGLRQVEDLLYWFPRDYEDRQRVYTVADAPEGERCCVAATVTEAPSTGCTRSGLEITRLKAADDTGVLALTFFRQSYVRTALRVGQRYIFYGSLETFNSRKTMVNPVFDRVTEERQTGRTGRTGRIVPVYRLTGGITNALLMGAVDRALEDCGEQIPDAMPPAVRQRYQLAQAAWSVRQIHFPDSWETLEVARRRLIFEELFYFSAGLELMRKGRDREPGPVCQDGDLTGFYALLPFTLTNAQRRAAEEAARDLISGAPMNRLLQGDVGSGKTVVGAACVWLMARSGFQSAMMAPTEILAEQHAKTLRSLLEPGGIQVALLTGSLPAAEKRRVCDRIVTGGADLVIGTHALLSDPVEFARLGLVITDEQHRFGVHQRSTLVQKGRQGDGAPHVLVMSATPIPRTLALILYGDLDVSVIDERPPGRQTVDTFLVGEDKRQRLYNFVRRQVREGHQVYIVCPAVEEGQETEGFGQPPLKAAAVYAEQLQREVFPDLRVGLLHGKMRGAQKEQVMSAFSAGEIDVLVATTVIEVGVDVPNATLMIVENAERFGLSQLHQLRGRVGRGDAKSYCVLISAHRGQETRRRLKALCATNDGFRIAEEDLKLRGPGDFFGSRQHGLPQLRVADLAGDTRVLQEAREAVEWVFQRDSGLQKPENQGIINRMESLFRETRDSFN